MASANINNSGWKNIKQIYIKTGTTWTAIKSGWIKVGTLWKQFFASGAYSDSGTTISTTYTSYHPVLTPYITGTTSHWQNAVSLSYVIQKNSSGVFSNVVGPYSFTNPAVGATYTSGIGYTVQAGDFNTSSSVFRFAVTALDAGGTSYTESADLTIYSVPQNTTLPSLSVNASGLFTATNGSWTAGATSYTYDFQYSATGSSYASVQNSASNTYAAGTTFGYYKVLVTATNSFGSGSAAASSAINYNTAPTDPGITVVANSNATLTFTATFGANTDFVLLEYDTSTAYANMTTISTNGGSYTTPALSPDTLYYYRARGFNSATSTYSSPGTTGTKRTAVLPGLVPTFSGPTAIANGFWFKITNYDSSYSWSATSSSGTAAIVYDALLYTGWAVRVTGLSASAAATATLTLTRTGYTTTVTTTPTGYAGPAQPVGSLSAGSTSTSGVLSGSSSGASRLMFDLYRSSTSGGALTTILSSYTVYSSSASIVVSSVSPYINGYYSGWVYAYNSNGDMLATFIPETYVYTGPPSNGTVSITSSGTGNYAVGETITVQGGGYYGNPTIVTVILQRSLDNATWTNYLQAPNVVGQAYTSVTYTITNTDAAPPPYYYRGATSASNANSIAPSIYTASHVSTGYVAPFSFTPSTFSFTPFSFTPFSFTPAFGFTPFSFTPFAFNRFNFTGSCVHEDTLIRTLNGYVKAKELHINDKVLSIDISELPDNGPNGEVQYDYTTWESPSLTSPDGFVETTVVDVRQRIVDGTIYFNGESTKLFSLAHPMFVYSNNQYEIKPTSLVEVGDCLISIGQNGEIINTLVESIDTIDGEQVVYQFDMEPQDWYISGDLLGHNK